LLFGGGGNKNIRTNDPMPSERIFKVLNTEGIIEEGKKKALKNRDLVIRGLGFKPVKHTSAGWPAVSGEGNQKLFLIPT
jgi:DNA polymerase-1